LSNIDLVGVGNVVRRLELGGRGVEAGGNAREGITRLDDVGGGCASRRARSGGRRGTRRGSRGRRRTAATVGDATLRGLVKSNTGSETVSSSVDGTSARGNITSIRALVQVVGLPEPTSSLERPLLLGNQGGVVYEVLAKVATSSVVVEFSSQLNSTAADVLATTVVVLAPAISTARVGIFGESVVVVRFLASLGHEHDNSVPCVNSIARKDAIQFSIPVVDLGGWNTRKHARKCGGRHTNGLGDQDNGG